MLLLIIWMMVEIIDEGCNDEGLWEMKQRVEDVKTIFRSLWKKGWHLFDTRYTIHADLYVVLVVD